MAELPSGYEIELAELRRLAQAAVQHVGETEINLEGWEKIAAQVEARSGESALLQEDALEQLTRRLRILCLQAAHKASDRTLRSPTQDDVCRRIDGRRLAFGYERDLDPSAVERKLALVHPAPISWQSAYLAFSSGQAAMAALAMAIAAQLPSSRRPLRTKHLGAYFETTALFGVLAQAGTYLYRQGPGDGDGATADIVIFEPVYYDGIGRMVTGDLAALRQLLMSPQRPSVLVIDATLSGVTFPHEQLLAGVDGFDGLIVLLRSCLKLDQAGLELANVGAISLFARPKADPSLQGMVDALREIRNLTGANLSFDAINALSYPWCLDAGYMAAYCRQLFDNNRRLAEVLRDKDAILCLHPQNEVGAPSWAAAPFCILQLKDKRHDAYRAFGARIVTEASAQGLKIDQGGSFGFRGHRFDVILPEDDTPAFIRIAMGYRTGPGCAGLIKMFAEF